MPVKRKKRSQGKIFESIRKPTAPPSKKFGNEKPEAKAHPTDRKAKHKKKSDDNLNNGDI